ncbi:MAG: acylneuraminate cytidylyltransferase family protein [Candidatus Sungbacteria bacterium]|nr:acylneuraminate cytidylyltransferase family protein [Candidatus Sungbacteria bacterium]
MGKEILGIIPARGGSKSIPRKNIKIFAGKPLIAWAIETLKQSGAVSRVMVSTDDEEIAKAAKDFGAEVPFMRPKELAEDLTPTLPVLQHAVQWLQDNEGYRPDYVVLLEPTSPSKRPFHVKGVVEMLLKTGVDSVISVAEVPGVFSPHWQIKIGEDDRVELFTGGTMKDVIRRRQDLPKTYYRNSSIYVFKPELLFADDPSFYGEDVRAYVTDSKYAFDIDTSEDWEFAERQFKKILEDEK